MVWGLSHCMMTEEGVVTDRFRMTTAIIDIAGYCDGERE